MFAHLLLSKQTFFTLKRDVWACHLYRNVFLNKSSALNGNVSLEWKCFLVTVKKNDPGVWTVYGASRHVKGWRKMTAVSHQDLTAFTKQLTPFWKWKYIQKGDKMGVFLSPFFSFHSLCFPLQSCSDTALIYDSTSTWGEKGNQLELMWWILESSTLSFRREGGDLANQLELVLQKSEAHLLQRRKIRH